jgi:hypothetical protein
MAAPFQTKENKALQQHEGRCQYHSNKEEEADLRERMRLQVSDFFRNEVFKLTPR